MIFAQLGKPLASGQASLSNATLSATLFVTGANGWLDLYTLHITSTDSAVNTVTVSDGTTTLTYYVGGNPGGNNVPVYDQCSVPVRFKKGATVTVAAGAISSGKTVQVLARGLFSMT